MDLRRQLLQAQTRRHFLHGAGLGLGSLALADLAAADAPRDPHNPLAPRPPMYPAKAKHVIYLHMSGAPPQHDLWDHKPTLNKYHMKECPAELLKGERFAFIKGTPKMLGSPHKFAKHGQSGQVMSELLPNLAQRADDLCVVRSMFTDQINHAPAELFLFTGSPRFDGAAMGSWATWGLGSENANLPGYVVLISGGTDPTGGKACWSSGFLPSVHQGTQCRTAGEPVLFVQNPEGMSRASRRASLDALRDLNEAEFAALGDPETRTRVSQYELAFRMQMSVPDVADIAREKPETLALYGAKPGQGSFANNCLLARRLVERGVRFVQLFDWGWDCHGTGAGDDIVTQLPKKCQETDRPIAALLADLRRLGLLDETLVVWGGEFGRTPMNEARGGSKFLGRDHHPHAFTAWLAGAGVKRGLSFGQTDELGYRPVGDKVSIRDLQATILHLLGLDPFKFHYRYQGLNQRLIGPTDEARVRKELLS